MSWRGRSANAGSSTTRELAEMSTRLASSTADSSRMRQAFDALPIGVVLSDAAGQIELRNARATSQTGHAKVLVAAAVERQLQRARSGASSSETVEFFGPPRTVLVVEAIPIGDGRTLATIEDVSERSRLDRVRTDFVANISHELKTPVGALAVLAEALADEREPEVIGRLAARIADEAHRAARTIDDLLELSRIELGGLALREAVSVDMLIDDALGRTAVAAERRGADVVTRGTPGLMAWGDSRQLVSALANLVENAVKYSPEDAEVTVAARGDESWVYIDVIDHGVGIPATDLDRIFERFYRVDQARSRVTGGTGLGLAIVRHVASNHGGDISVVSREGEGSTFTLRIPACGG